MNFIDDLLNRFTMYKVVLYGLVGLVILSFIYSFLGILSFPPQNLLVSLLIISISCFVSNEIFAKIFKVPTNSESYLISALILFLVLIPLISVQYILTLVAVSVIAMGSKYIIAINKKHIFNPAAFALVVIGIAGSPLAQWWVGNTAFFPAVVILGFLVLRKIRRFSLFLTFFVISLFSILISTYLSKGDPITLLPQIILSWPIIFMGSIMLTEPMTTPPTRKLQMIYGAVVGILTAIHFQAGPIFSAYEVDIVIGNIFSYAVSFKRRLVLTLKEKIELSPTVYEFVFNNSYKNFAFTPGQYMDWTLAHKKADIRGDRRYFTIASSPTEQEVRIGVKIDLQRSSTFKKALMSLPVGGKIFAGQLVGEFTLPQDHSLPLVFIAGGIGITPFRSMVKYLLDKNEKRNITLIYSSKDVNDFVFKEIFDKAGSLGIKIIYTITDEKNVPKNWKGSVGRVSMELIKNIPDYQKSMYYLSGPHALVEGFDKEIREAGISRSKIKKDFFPGFV